MEQKLMQLPCVKLNVLTNRSERYDVLRCHERITFYVFYKFLAEQALGATVNNNHGDLSAISYFSHVFAGNLITITRFQNIFDHLFFTIFPILSPQLLFVLISFFS